MDSRELASQESQRSVTRYTAIEHDAGVRSSHVSVGTTVYPMPVLRQNQSERAGNFLRAS
jgi:hypothetical protein